MPRKTGRPLLRPAVDPTTLDVPLYPRSAQALLDLLEERVPGHPQYVEIDLDNFRNQLRAHLQRVAQGA